MPQTADWKRYEKAQEYTTEARLALVTDCTHITDKELMLSNLLGWCQKEIEKLQENEEVK